MKGCIHKRGERKFAIVIDLPRGADGKRRQKWHTVEGSKRDAEAELARLLHELNTGGYIEAAETTVGEFLRQWLEDYARPNVARTTYEGYGKLARIHLIPGLGHHRLDQLRPIHIQSYYARELVSGRKDGRAAGLSAKSVLHQHRLLRLALQWAVKWQVLARNPAAAVEAPRPRQQEMIAFDAEETARLLIACRNTPTDIPVLLAVTTGLRRGEVLGVRWEDLDLRAGTLSVRQSLEETKAGLAFKMPKTPKSRRAVALPAFVLEALIRHKGAQAEQKLLLGPAYKDSGLVVAWPDGSPLRPAYVTLAFARLARKLGLPSTRFHDLRHTHASQLLKEGIHPKVVSERLGHATVGITLDRYSHPLPGLQEEAARRVDVALRAAMGE